MGILQSAETPWRAVLADGTWLGGEALLRLACDTGIVVAKTARDRTILDVGRRTRTVPNALMHALRLRDGGCRFPGCTHQAYVDAHHIQHWAHGGETSLRNTVLLCSMHHHLVHEGGFTIDRHGDGTLMFIDPLGDAIDEIDLPVRPRFRPWAFHPKTNLPKWDGAKLDLPETVQGLVRRAGLAEVLPTA